MSQVTSIVTEFINKNCNKESISTNEVINFITQISMASNGSKNLQEGFSKLFSLNDMIERNTFLRTIAEDNKNRLDLFNESIDNKIKSNKLEEETYKESKNFEDTKILEIFKILNGLTGQQADYILSLAKSNLKQNSIIQISSSFDKNM